MAKTFCPHLQIAGLADGDRSQAAVGRNPQHGEVVFRRGAHQFGVQSFPVVERNDRAIGAL